MEVMEKQRGASADLRGARPHVRGCAGMPRLLRGHRRCRGPRRADRRGHRHGRLRPPAAQARAARLEFESGNRGDGMKSNERFIRIFLGLASALIGLTALAADYPEPKEGQWVVPAFKFHTGEVLKELKLHYTTVGAPEGEPVLVMHGTTGSAKSMLTPGFAGQLFGPGEPLDASRYFIILPDALGHGKSSKPSD